jgi:hypothetical protein
MKLSNSFLLAVSLFTISLVIAISASAETDRYENCYQQYELYSQIAIETGDSEASRLAAKYYRCVKRFDRKGLTVLAAKKSIQARIRALKKKIRRLEKNISKVWASGSTQKALKMGLRLASLQQKLVKLESKLSQGQCSSRKTKLTFSFENNSDFRVTYYIIDNKGMGHRIGDVAPVTIGKKRMTLKKLQSYVGTGATRAELYFLAIVNNQEVWRKAWVSLEKLPTKKPCTATAKWEWFNSTFPPTVTEGYYFFWVDAGPNLYVGKESDLKSRTPYSFRNGGMDNVNKVTYNKLSGKKDTIAAAGQALCSMIADTIWWKLMAPCQKRVKLSNGKYAWACESSVQTAIKNHCPQWLDAW